MKIEKKRQIQNGISALKDQLRKQYLTPTQPQYLEKGNMVEVVYSGSDSATKPETLATLNVQQRKAEAFKQLLNEKGVNFTLRKPETAYIDYNDRQLKLESAIFTFDVVELAKLVQVHQARLA